MVYGNLIFLRNIDDRTATVNKLIVIITPISTL